MDNLEWKTRVDLAAAFRLVDLYGWSDMLATHLSARIPGPSDHFLINPMGVLFEEMTASDLIKLDIDGNILSDTSRSINPAGYTIHSAIHGAREDAMCVIHTHTEAGMAVSSLEEGLIYTNQDAMQFYGHTAYHDFEGIALDLSERETLVSDLSDNKVMILRNHGLLTTGHTIADAWVQMYFLEKVCKAQLTLLSAAAATGQKVIYPTKEVCEHTAKQYEAAGCGEREWPSLIRQLDEVTTEYKY